MCVVVSGWRCVQLRRNKSGQDARAPREGRMTVYHVEHALLPEGVRSSVRIDVDNGVIRSVASGEAQAGDERIRGLVLPGMANVHSHSFQRAMAGLAEWDAGGKDNFWSWREAMYRFAERLN